MPHCPGAVGKWSSCGTLPHCLEVAGSGTTAHHRLRAMRSGTPAVHYLAAWGHWAAEMLRHTASLPDCIQVGDTGTLAVHCLIALGHWAVEVLGSGSPGQWKSCWTVPHYLGAVGSASLAANCVTHCHSLGPVGSETPTLHYLTAWGQWTADLVQLTASLPGGSAHWNSCGKQPHYLGGEGSGTLAPNSLMLHTASLPGGSAQWNS